MFEIGYLPAHNLLTVRVSGNLTADDCEAANSDFKQAVDQAEGKLNAVFEIAGLRGWSIAELWKALKFDVKHFDDFRRIAAVVQPNAAELGGNVPSTFTNADVKFFTIEEIDDAKSWAIGE